MTIAGAAILGFAAEDVAGITDFKEALTMVGRNSWTIEGIFTNSFFEGAPEATVVGEMLERRIGLLFSCPDVYIWP